MKFSPNRLHCFFRERRTFVVKEALTDWSGIAILRWEEKLVSGGSYDPLLVDRSSCSTCGRCHRGLGLTAGRPLSKTHFITEAQESPLAVHVTEVNRNVHIFRAGSWIVSGRKFKRTPIRIREKIVDCTTRSRSAPPASAAEVSRNRD